MKELIGVILFGTICFIFGGYSYYEDVIVPKLEECQKNLPRNEFCELKALPKQKSIEEK